MEEKVHAVKYASQPDIQILCDDSWSTPGWGTLDTGAETKIYKLDDGRHYTFDEQKVTCKACLADKGSDD